MKRLLAILLVFSAAPVAADERPIAPTMPPPGFTEPVFVDARGCTYVRATVGDWVLWVQQLDAANRPACDAMPGKRRQQDDVLAAQRL